MLKRVVGTVLLICFVLFSVMGCSKKADTSDGTKQVDTQSQSQAQTEELKKPVVIEVMLYQTEYEAAEKQIWNEYEKANPHVTIKTETSTEGQEQAFAARIAAGTPPHLCFQQSGMLNKETYQNYVNLLDIDYPYWDLLTFDGKKIWEEQTGIKDYVPTLSFFDTFTSSFMYYEDEMQKAGLNPSSIRTWTDLDAFLAELKIYVDKTDGIDYVFDTGWHEWGWFYWWAPVWSLSMGHGYDEQLDLFTGKIRWDDLEKNPYVDFFEKLKEYYQKGYMPKNWCFRDWENEFEASFINRKSIFTYHGPWLWDKVLAANADAQLSGIPLPASPDGDVATYPVNAKGGAGMFKVYESQPIFEEMKKAFIWYCSPEQVKKVGEAMGTVPSMKLDTPLTINHPQYLKVFKQVNDGIFGNAKWISDSFPIMVAGKYDVAGTPSVMDDKGNAETFQKYLNNDISLADLMGFFQKRWEAHYKIQ